MRQIETLSNKTPTGYVTLKQSEQRSKDINETKHCRILLPRTIKIISCSTHQGCPKSQHSGSTPAEYTLFSKAYGHNSLNHIIKDPFEPAFYHTNHQTSHDLGLPTLHGVDFLVLAPHPRRPREKDGGSPRCNMRQIQRCRYEIQRARHEQQR